MPNPFAKKARRLFSLIVFMGVVPFAALVFVSWYTHPLIRTALRTMLDASGSACQCERAVLSYISASYWGGAFVAVFALVLFLSVLAITGVRLSRRTRAFVHFHLKDGSDGIFAFCYGLLRPKVCVSSGLLKRLSRKEANIVLRHEAYHQKTREPLKNFIIHLVQSVFSFIPSFSLLAEQYQTYTELAADFFATRGFRDKKHLAGALYVMLEWKESFGAACPTFGGVTDARVRVLSSPRAHQDAPLLNRRVLLHLSLVPLFLIMVYSAIFFAKPVSYAREDTSERMCRLVSSAGAYRCEMYSSRGRE